MKIVSLTPGTGNFHCGSCLRDEALTASLRRMQHDVMLVPLYLPLVTEGLADDVGKVFVGGINIYLQDKVGLFKHTPRAIDRLFDNKRLLKMAADRAGMTDAHELGRLTVSMLRGEHGVQNKEMGYLLDFLAKQGKPDVVVLSNALLCGMADPIRRALGVPVLCTLQGEDSFLDDLPDPHRDTAWDELRERAKSIDGFIAVSEYYGASMADRMSLPPGSVRVIANGIALDGHVPAAQPPDPPAIGYLARLCAPKGLHALVDAYIRLRERGKVNTVKLRIAGAMIKPDHPYVDEQKAKLDKAGVLGDVSFHTNLSRDEKLAFLQSISLLSVPAMYGESFGLYVIEALASGAPVVQPNHAAFPELLAATGGGILSDDASPDALAEAYEALLLDEPRRASLGAQGRAAVHEKFSVDRAAADIAAYCQHLVDASAT